MTLSKWMWRTCKFAAIGILGTIIYAMVGLLCVRAGLSLMSSHILAFIISNAVSYFGQKVFTFSIAGEHRTMGARFALAIAMLVISQTIVILMSARLLGLSNSTSILIGTVYYPPASYLLHSLWTFRQTPISRR